MCLAGRESQQIVLSISICRCAMAYGIWYRGHNPKFSCRLCLCSLLMGWPASLICAWMEGQESGGVALLQAPASLDSILCLPSLQLICDIRNRVAEHPDVLTVQKAVGVSCNVYACPEVWNGCRIPWPGTHHTLGMVQVLVPGLMPFLGRAQQLSQCCSRADADEALGAPQCLPLHLDVCPSALPELLNGCSSLSQRTR